MSPTFPEKTRLPVWENHGDIMLNLVINLDINLDIILKLILKITIICTTTSPW